MYSVVLCVAAVGVIPAGYRFVVMHGRDLDLRNNSLVGDVPHYCSHQCYLDLNCLTNCAFTRQSWCSPCSATSSKSVSSRWVGGPRQVWGGGRGGVHAFPQAIRPLALAQLQQCTWLMSEPRWVGWGGTIVAVVAPLCTEVRCTAMPFAIKEPC